MTTESTPAEPGAEAADLGATAAEPVSVEPVSVEPVAAVATLAPAPRPRHRRRRIGVALFVLLVPLLLVGGAAGGLLAWDSSFEGRILPGVRVGDTDLSGMDRSEATAAIAAAYPYQDGRVVVRTPDGDVTIAYADVGRRPDVDTMVDQAMASGRAGTALDRAVAQVRQALDGRTLEPRAVFDEAALTAAVTSAVVALDRDPIDATISMGPDGPVTTPARDGRTADPGPAVAAAVAGIAGTDAPPEVVVAVDTQPVPPAVADTDVALARLFADRVVGDVVVAWGKKKKWTIPAEQIRGWVTFATRPDGSIHPVVDTSNAPRFLAKASKAVARKPVNATFLRTRSGKPIGVVAGRDGRRLDAEATVARIATELEGRETGTPPEKVRVAVTKVAPKLTTEEARKTAPLMVRLGGWTTYFPISDRNYFGANIWRPAEIIDGTVLRPGDTFEWWRAIWPVTPARGFGPGGIIRSNRTDPTGALGGGMCSSSTTLFNAALRAGLRMGQRSNHKYYIDRYPLGLDATVSIIGNSRQTMTFTNDTGHPIVIRGIRIRGAGGRGYVRYEIWGIPTGRTVAISRPAVSNVRKATTNVVPVRTLARGVREQVEYPSNGMDVTVTRVVRNKGGRVIHRDVYRTHYVLWNGRIEVGT